VLLSLSNGRTILAYLSSKDRSSPLLQIKIKNKNWSEHPQGLVHNIECCNIGRGIGRTVLLFPAAVPTPCTLAYSFTSVTNFRPQLSYQSLPIRVSHEHRFHSHIQCKSGLEILKLSVICPPSCYFNRL
jgi:hypothetical protein